MKSELSVLSGELATEFKTVQAMVAIYCRDHHQDERLGAGVCVSCRELLDYAEMRLDRCPYGQTKPTCNKCPIHCYKPDPKEQMQAVMRYAGPRMLLPHPLLSIRHLLHERRAVPAKPEAGLSNRSLRKQRGD
ncbi:nitrous oxide-stimulated promoter family protein [Vibrio methylphosphonaticus]|uniref:nitrous oxide-stimulated promoter family protein n=1 Tax=Vibrio methylphosphonaticus TaxID=2946866 RepID=UPI00202A6E55|nr:nitrous oxide-stimulated promoter family protein [Vibrio methylphosphonaticus]MCL9776607.1 nitrous oxide-stimulated promoter family protein [Vibrio methylphosphonaticus]